MTRRTRRTVAIIGIAAVAVFCVASLAIVVRAWSRACCAAPLVMFDGGADDFDAAGD